LTDSDNFLSFPDTGGDRTGSLIRAAAMRGYSDLVRDLGGDPEALLSRFHIPADAEHQEDAFVSFGSFVRMLEASAEDLHCPDFGLRLSRWQGLDILGPIAVIARNAQTVLGGFEAIARYLYIHSPALTLTGARVSDEANVQFTYEVTEPGVPYALQGYELSMAIGVRILHLLGGPEARPRVIAFLHDQRGSDTAYREALGCLVRFGQTWCGFELPARLADWRIDNADPETSRTATKYLESNYLPSTASLSERVAALTRRLLPTGQCSADVIANELAIHPRTLQRRLANEGVRCQDLIDRERRAQAARYLSEPGLHLSQIAGLLGYAEQSALNRSCRRWFGMTPRQYRASPRAGANRS
jgi:AraC-like DNA-binding protein